MGRRLGIHSTQYNPYQGLPIHESDIIRQLNIYPEEPLISAAQWQSIVNYYIAQAPDSLISGSTPKMDPTPAPFTAQLVNIGDKQVPQVSLLEYDAASGQLFIGDHKDLYALNHSGALSGYWQLEQPLSDIIINNDSIYLLEIGSIPPSDKQEGRLVSLSDTEEGHPISPTIDLLARPVHVEIADLNDDGQQDVLIASFGNHQGKLAWYDNFQEEHVISALPGNRRTEIVDIDHDGDMDIVALRAQAWEALSIYYNDGKANFTEVEILRFDPVHGSSYFELADFNADGNLDVLMTNGDNWDLSPITKPYHGVRIYLNIAPNQYKEAFFYPIPGCNKAMSVDFDFDGDLDIIATSFYNSLEDPRGSIIYFENQGQLNFKPQLLQETVYGKWLTMDVFDYNKDGLPDVVLGSYYHSMAELSGILYQGITDVPQVLLLTNTY